MLSAIGLPTRMQENCGVAVPAQDGEGIDYELLQRRDPILFFDEVELFHDELADNGDSLLNVKVVLFNILEPCFHASAFCVCFPQQLAVGLDLEANPQNCHF